MLTSRCNLLTNFVVVFRMWERYVPLVFQSCHGFFYETKYRDFASKSSYLESTRPVESFQSASRGAFGQSAPHSMKEQVVVDVVIVGDQCSSSSNLSFLSSSSDVVPFNRVLFSPSPECPPPAEPPKVFVEIKEGKCLLNLGVNVRSLLKK